jgi:hypothetical protein
VNAREKAIQAHRELLNGGKLSYFEERGISAETVRAAWIGYDAASCAFTYPCIAKSRGLLGIHYKSEGREENGKRRQWWGAYAEDLPAKGHGKKPHNLVPACVGWYVADRGRRLEQRGALSQVTKILNEHLLAPRGEQPANSLARNIPKVGPAVLHFEHAIKGDVST